MVVRQFWGTLPGRMCGQSKATTFVHIRETQEGVVLSPLVHGSWVQACFLPGAGS